MAKFKIKVTDKNHSKQFLMDSDANFDQIIQIGEYFTKIYFIL